MACSLNPARLLFSLIKDWNTVTLTYVDIVLGVFAPQWKGSSCNELLTLALSRTNVLTLQQNNPENPHYT